MIKLGWSYAFDSHKLDSKYNHLTGTLVKVLRRLGPEEADVEVGPMFHVEAPNGERFDVFEDELLGDRPSAI